jgi:hypothetical protein
VSVVSPEARSPLATKRFQDRSKRSDFRILSDCKGDFALLSSLAADSPCYDENMRLWNFITNHWRIVYGIGIVIAVVYSIIGFSPEPSAEVDTIVYTKIVLRSMGIMPVLPMILLLWFGAALYCFKRRDFNNISLGLIVFPLIPVFLVLYDNQPRICDTRIFAFDSVTMDGRIYSLAGFCTFKVAVYECDSLEIVCHAIHRGGTPISKLEFDGKCRGDGARMYLSADDHTLSLISGCETVFSYRPP